MKTEQWSSAALALALGFVYPASAWCETPSQMLRVYETQAKTASGFAGFSAQRGEQFFKIKHGSDWSCVSCHTENPSLSGRHAKTGKYIAPLAPASNAERFSDPDKTEKWFRRNCNDVLGRSCSAAEKGDVLAYLIALGK